MNGPHPLRPTPLEIASGMVLGEAPDVAPLPQTDKHLSPIQAFEQAMLPALARPPCLVSFSGGRDSSAVLAVATRLARREGLPLPVPMSLRYTDAPETDESKWQEQVITHLRLEDWHRTEINEELDYIGPVACDVLGRHGVLWPPNTYVHELMLREASGGAVLTGVDGDGLLGGWKWRRAVDVYARRSRPGKRGLLRLAAAAAPRSVKRVIERRRTDLLLTWLREQAVRAVTEKYVAQESDEPVWWNTRVAWWGRRRYIAATSWSFGLLAADHAVLLVHPLLDPAFLAALARAGGRLGFGHRTAAMRVLFGDVLPEQVLARPDKAIFDQAFSRAKTRAFINSWDGAGIDHELIDESRLRELWSAPRAEFRTVMLLQSLFLASAGDHIEQPVGDHG